MKLLFTPEAIEDLRQIWLWNAEQHGSAHANNYIAFLLDEVELLIEPNLVTTRVPGAKGDVYYRHLGKRRRRPGHLVVYRVAADRIEIGRFFHSSQDWPRRVP